MCLSTCCLLVASIFGTLLLVTMVNGVTIMSIDFGSEWIKIAVVAPGVPMEIALNRESKRKTPAAIAFRDGQRWFGEDAIQTSIRFPSANYAYLIDLLGKTADNPIVDLYKKRFPYYKIETDAKRGTLVFRHDEETIYSVEELIAQQLSDARELAMAHTQQPIRDTVITVPTYFNQAERLALLAAAELAGLKVLTLMSANSAVALNYGMFRRKEVNATAQNILFYDMGASSTIATIVSYQKIKEKGSAEGNPSVTVLGVGYDRMLGGLEMQLRLRDFLARKFNEMKKTPKDAFQSPRTMAKFFKEAGRLKNVLSANAEHLSQVEGALDEQDFRLLVTRQEFEDLSSDLWQRVKSPIDAALVAASMDISAVSQLIIVGGGTRVPKVQALLQEAWGRELGKNINADEAAAMGAVYRAAELGQGFKVKKFYVKDAVLLPIEVNFERQAEPELGSSGSRVVKRMLFSVGNTFPLKKVMTFNKHTEDFSFWVGYGDVTHLPKGEISAVNAGNLTHVIVTGVTTAFAKHRGDNTTEAKGIKAHFSLDDSGVLTLTGMEALWERTGEEEEAESTLSRLGSTISKLFSGSDSPDDELKLKSPAEDEKEEGSKNEGSEAEKKKERESEKLEEGSGKETTKEEKKEEGKKSDQKKAEKNSEVGKKETKPKLVMVKEELQFEVETLDVKKLSGEDLKEAMKKLDTIASSERLRREREASRNALEGYLLDAQDKLSQDEYTRASVPEERDAILRLCSQFDEWLYEEGMEEEASIYKEKLSSIETLFHPVVLRVREHTERPEALQALKNTLNASEHFLFSAKSDKQLFTEVEINTLQTLINETKDWMKQKVIEQSVVPDYETPKLTLFMISEKIVALDREIKYMITKAKIAKAKLDREALEAKLKLEREAKAEERKKKKNKTEESLGNETEAAAEKFIDMEDVLGSGDFDTEKLKLAEKIRQMFSEENKSESKENPYMLDEEDSQENDLEGSRRRGGDGEEAVGGDEEEVEGDRVEATDEATEIPASSTMHTDEL